MKKKKQACCPYSSRRNPKFIRLIRSTLAILPSTKLICGGPDSRHGVRRHLHKLVYTTIVMIISVWSPVSVNEQKHLIHSNRYVSRSISLPYNWPQRSSWQSGEATFNVAREFVVLVRGKMKKVNKIEEALCLAPTTCENCPPLVEARRPARSVPVTAAPPGLVFLM